jgi:hypothetical protein
VDIVKLIRQIARAILGATPPSREEVDDWMRKQVGAVPLFETSWSQVISDLEALGLRCMIKEDAPDYKVFYTDEVTLARMVPFLTYPADDYVEERADCDDYAMWASADASRIFKLNGVRQCWGDTPLGPHAWSLALVGVGQYKLWEPNAGFAYAGELFDAGDNGYQPKKWK